MLKVYVKYLYLFYLSRRYNKGISDLNTGPTTGNSRKIPNTFVTVDREIH